MAEPFDLNAVIAEQTAEPFRFVFGDGTYVLPATPDIRAVAFLAEGHLEQALRALLGPDQWAQLEAEPSVFDVLAFRSLLDAYMAHTGAAVGEALASTDS
ncbi:MAG: hypothetical protein AB7H43_10705 [Acidimicrobiia bacterium]